MIHLHVCSFTIKHIVLNTPNPNNPSISDARDHACARVHMLMAAALAHMRHLGPSLQL